MADDRAHRSHNPFGLSFALPVKFFRAIQRLAQADRLLSLFGRQVRIPGTHREAVRLAQGRSANDTDREVQVAHHALDDSQLLSVLFSKYGDVRQDDVEQLRDYRANAAKMSRPRRAAQAA